MLVAPLTCGLLPGGYAAELHLQNNADLVTMVGHSVLLLTCSHYLLVPTYYYTLICPKSWTWMS
jgi:hypothetical protein